LPENTATWQGSIAAKETRISIASGFRQAVEQSLTIWCHRCRLPFGFHLLASQAAVAPAKEERAAAEDTVKRLESVA